MNHARSLLFLATAMVVGGVVAQSPQPAASPESRPTDSRPVADSRPRFNDIPDGARDPLLEGMRTIARELIQKGFDPAEKSVLVDRITSILERTNLADDARRKNEAASVAQTLLQVQIDFRPKTPRPADKPLTQDEDRRAGMVAENLARDIYKRLPLAAAQPAAGGSTHTGFMRAAPTVKVPDGYEAVAWKTLGGFDYTEGMKLPESVTRLNGAKIGVAGYMMTLEEVENIHEFLLVESLWSCCFGTPPNVNQVLLVHLEGTKGIDFTGSPVVILGTLEVGEKVEDGFVTSVYRLRATSVKIAE